MSTPSFTTNYTTTTITSLSSNTTYELCSFLFRNSEYNFIAIVTKEKEDQDENQKYILKCKDNKFREYTFFKEYNLQHKSIVKCHDSWIDKNKTYLVLDYYPLGDLHSYIQENTKLTEEKSKLLIRTLLETLYYLHSNNIIHNDIKPENLLLKSSSCDELILFDFELYIPINAEKKIYGGTAYFMSPEVLNRREFNEKVDVWSTGITLYAMLVGYFPFHFNEIGKRQIRVPTFLSEKAGDLLKKLLDINPETRISVKEALLHEWFEIEKSEANINQENDN